MIAGTRPSSLTRGLIVGLTVGATLLWSAGTGFGLHEANEALNQAFDGALQQAARRLLPMAVDEAQGKHDDDAAVLNRLAASRHEYLGFELRDASGRVRVRANDAGFAPLLVSPPPGFANVGSYRTYSLRDARSGMLLTLAEDLQNRRGAVAAVALAMIGALAMVLVLNAILIWLITRRAMRPVRRLSADIATRSALDLRPLDISDQPIELRPIASSVSQLVDRLRAALEAERAMAASSAHELRTPLAGALAQTQRLIHGLREPQDLRRARDVEATLKRLVAFAEKIMQISRIDAGFSRGLEEIDLAPVLDFVVSDYARRADLTGRIDYLREPGLRLVARIDADAFAIAVGNLVENALKHGDPADPVRIRARSEGVVSVANGGAIVPPEILSEVRRRYSRGSTRAFGAGLGLAIVDDIMTQTGGSLELLSPRSEAPGGFEARLILRLSATPAKEAKRGKSAALSS